MTKILKTSSVLLILVFCSLNTHAQNTDLYHTIAGLDSAFFHAYNTCDTVMQEEFYSDSIEFFHDRSGLETSKQKILDGTKKYICGKVTRELVKGSIEVSPVVGYGAVEIGMHLFHNNQEKDDKPKPSRFVIMWKQYVDRWRITKVISLH